LKIEKNFKKKHTPNNKKVRKIKSITTYQIDDSDSDSKFISAYTEYNETGNEVLSETYYDENELESKVERIYNSRGEIIEEITYLDATEIGEHTFFKRNEQNRIAEILSHYADGSKQIKKYEYNDAENTLTITTYDDDDAIEEREFFRFDSDRNILEHSTFDENLKLKERQENSYDENSKLLRRKEYDAKNKFTVERVLVYNEFEKIEKQISLNKNNKPIGSILFNYDDKGRLIEQRIANSHVIRFAYTDEPRTEKEEHFDANGILTYSTTKYYDQNNLLTQANTLTGTLKYSYLFFD